MNNYWEVAEQLQLSNENGEFFIFHQNKCYKVSRYTYLFIEQMKLKKSLFDAEAEFKNLYDFDNSKFDLIINSYNSLIEKIKKNSLKKQTYIKGRVTLLNENFIDKITHLLKYLFKPYILYPLFAMVILYNLYYSVNYNLKETLKGLSYFEIAYMYVISICVYIFHEIGHSSATKYFGLRTHDIGFGFYFIFPVFYSDITRVWMISKEKRVVVNVGGVYFQLLMNSMLILIVEYVQINPVLCKIIMYIIQTNIIVVCYSMLPFFRNDGYWMYSDIFNIKNLTNISDKKIIELAGNFIRMKKINYSNISKPVLVYGILNWVFRGYILFVMIRLLIVKIVEFNCTGYIEIIKNIFGIFIVLTGLYFMVNYVVRILFSRAGVSEGI